MRNAQLITFGVDDDTAEGLQPLLRGRGVGLRITRNPKACVNLLRQGAVGVLLLRVGRNLESELALLAQVTQQYPEVAAVVWGDADHPRLAGLACELGARAVLLPPSDQDRLKDILRSLLPE